MFKKIMGKSKGEGFVVINTGGSSNNYNYYIYHFPTEEKSNKFYDSIKLGKNRLIGRKIISKFCRHKNIVFQKVASNSYGIKGFDYCKNCKISWWKDFSTEEEKKLTDISIQVEFKQANINTARNTIEDLEYKLHKEKERLENDLEELAELYEEQKEKELAYLTKKNA